MKFDGIVIDCIFSPLCCNLSSFVHIGEGLTPNTWVTYSAILNHA
jgi:hypothetical protein